MISLFEKLAIRAVFTRLGRSQKNTAGSVSAILILTLSSYLSKLVSDISLESVKIFYDNFPEFVKIKSVGILTVSQILSRKVS